MKLHNITMTVHIHPRDPGPLSSDEKKQLADFFIALMDLRPNQNINDDLNKEAISQN